MRKLQCGVAVLGVLAIVAASGPATAAPVLRLENVGTGTGVVILDNGVGDLDARPGVINFSGAITPGFTLNFEAIITKPELSGAVFHVNSVNVRSSGGGTLRVSAEETGFTTGLDTLGTLTGAVGGLVPSGGSATFQSWINPDNLVPDYGSVQPTEVLLPALGGVPAGSVAAWPVAPVFGPGAFASTSSADFLKSGPYSLFAQATLTFTAGGVFSFDEEQRATAIPEPATLLLLGFGAVPLIRRFRHKV